MYFHIQIHNESINHAGRRDWHLISQSNFRISFAHLRKLVLFVFVLYLYATPFILLLNSYSVFSQICISVKSFSSKDSIHYPSFLVLSLITSFSSQIVHSLLSLSVYSHWIYLWYAFLSSWFWGENGTIPRSRFWRKKDLPPWLRPTIPGRFLGLRSSTRNFIL